jgi:hypothetical protein
LTVSDGITARGSVVVVDVAVVVVVDGVMVTGGASVVVVDEVVVDDDVVEDVVDDVVEEVVVEVDATVVVVVDVVVVVVVVVDVVVVVVVPVLMSAPALSATKLSPMCDAVVPTRDVLPDPRRPLPPLPQHFTDASSSMAHVCARPAETASTVRPAPRLTVASASPISPGPSPMLF